MKGYRSQLAQPYLSEDNTLTFLKKEAFDRLQYEVRASHILIKSDLKDSPEDTLKAYNKAMKLKKSIKNEKQFAAMAETHSDDPSAEQNKGDLGYFTAFYMVYPFESAAYNTAVGEVSDPVRTRFGYHLLFIHDKRPSNGNMTAAHILISTDPDISSAEDPKEKADEIYKKIKSGEVSFEEMAENFSDDPRSARQGGLLPTFSVGRMVKEFEAAAYQLENDGDISEPSKSPYGWHIIKRIKKELNTDYKTMEPELAQKVKKDSRSKLTETASIKKIKKDYGFKENPNALKDYLSKN